jgi:hypothetical protein
MKLPFLFPSLLLLTSVPAMAADFAATIDSNHVKSGESVTLQLTLSGAKAEGAPDVGALRQSFTIVSQVQSSSIVIGNGTTSTDVRWQLTLLPKREGRQILSEMNLDGSMVSISAMASTTKPYQNQSIRYTVRCTARGNISDVTLGDIDVNNAIVQQEGKPDAHDEIENGSAVRIVEIHYIITPLQPDITEAH